MSNPLLMDFPSTLKQIAERERRNQIDAFSSMLDLAERDEGMKDLLDRAREYYYLKRNT